MSVRHKVPVRKTTKSHVNGTPSASATVYSIGKVVFIVSEPSVEHLQTLILTKLKEKVTIGILLRKTKGAQDSRVTLQLDHEYDNQHGS